MKVHGTKGPKTCPLARAALIRFPQFAKPGQWLSIGMEKVTAGPISMPRISPLPPGAREFLVGFQAKECLYPDLWKGSK